MTDCEAGGHAQHVVAPWRVGYPHRVIYALLLEHKFGVGPKHFLRRVVGHRTPLQSESRHPEVPNFPGQVVTLRLGSPSLSGRSGHLPTPHNLSWVTFSAQVRPDCKPKASPGGTPRGMQNTGVQNQTYVSFGGSE